MSSRSNLAAQHAAAFFVLGLLEGTDVKVRFGAGPFYVPEDQTIWFPNYPTLVKDESQPGLQARLNRLYRAIAMHESGHPLYTGDDCNTGKLGFQLWMSLEDVRCDCLNQRRHKGGKLIYEEGYSELIAEGFWKPISSDSGLVSVFAAWVLYRARHLIAGQQCFGELADASHDAMRALVEEADLNAAWSIVALARTARSSADVVQIVNRLMTWLKQQLDAQKEDTPPPPSQDSDQQQDPSADSGDQSQDPQGSGEDSGSASGSDDTGDGTNEDPGANTNGGAGDDDVQPSDQPSTGPSGEDASGDDNTTTQKADGDGDANDPAKPGGDDDSTDSGTQPSSKPQSAPAGDDASGVDTAASGQSGGDTGSIDDDASAGSTPSNQGVQSDDDASDGGSAAGDGGSPLSSADIAEIDGLADDLPQDVGTALASAFKGASQQAIKAGATWSTIPQCNRRPASGTAYIGDADTRPFSIQLTRLLRTRSSAMVTHDRRGARIDPQMLVRWPLGEREVFVEESEVRQVDTAVMVVVDDSPSMRVVPAVPRGQPVPRSPIEVARSAALRLCKSLLEVPGTAVSAISFPDVDDGGGHGAVRTLLPFGGTIRAYAQNFLDLDANNKGSTPLHLALTKARYELLRQPQPRRICIVKTDGEPDHGNELVGPILDLMQQDGIEVIGVGIKTMAVQSLFARHKVIQDLAELEPALFSLLQSALLNKRAA